MTINVTNCHGRLQEFLWGGGGRAQKRPPIITKNGPHLEKSPPPHTRKKKKNVPHKMKKIDRIFQGGINAYSCLPSSLQVPIIVYKGINSCSNMGRDDFENMRCSRLRDVAPRNAKFV